LALKRKTATPCKQKGDDKVTPIKLLSDFRRHGLIGKWFGELQLIGVGYPKDSSRRNNDLVCRVSCAQGHGAVRSWRKLQDRGRSICSTCRAARRPGQNTPVISVTPARLIRLIRQLEPERRKLFDALLVGRRQAPGDETTGFHLVKDAYNYALVVTDPAKDLAELIGEPGRAGAGASSSLATGMFTYFEGVD
jgi:hypothetical protein